MYSDAVLQDWRGIGGQLQRYAGFWMSGNAAWVIGCRGSMWPKKIKAAGINEDGDLGQTV